MDELSDKNPESKPAKISIWKLLVSVVVVLLVVTGLSYYYMQRDRITSRIVIDDYLPEKYQFEQMMPSEYPEGFPKDLVVEGEIRTRAEDTTTGSGERLKIVELVYEGVQPEELMTLYQESLKEGGWVLENTQSEIVPIVKTFAKNMEVMTLTIIAIENTSLIENGSLANFTLRIK